MPGLIGKKIGMTSVFGADGKNIPCTVIEAGPCVVTQLRTVEKDGYAAVQLAYDETTEKHASAPLKGHFAKAGTTPHRKLAEFAADFKGELKLGDVLTVADIFEGVEYVDVIGTSKGKGFQGAIKRHGQHRGPMAHGSKFHRHQGSNGSSSDPSRVFKGKGMPGHMGAKKITVQNLEIVKVDVENNLILVKGAVPGPKKSLVTLKETVKSGK